MPFGEVTQRLITPPGRAQADVDLDAGVFTMRLVDEGSAFPDTIQAVSPDVIGVDSIDTDNVSLYSIIPEQITADSLSAISANLGTVTAGTVIGATIMTSVSNPRVVIDSTGIKMTDSGGTQTFFAAAATGVLALGRAGQQIVFDPALLANQRLYLDGQLVGTGTILGPTFQTNDPGNNLIRIDGTSGFYAESSVGDALMRIDPSQGDIRIYTPSSQSELAFHDSPVGSAQVRLIGFDTGLGQIITKSDFMVQTDFPNTTYSLLSMDDLGWSLGRVVSSVEQQYIQGDVGIGVLIGAEAAGNNQIWLDVNAGNCEFHYGTQLNFGRNAALTGSILMRGGHLVGSTTNWLCQSLSTFSCTVGHRFTGAGAGTNFGHFFHYKDGVRTDGAGNAVTPASATLGGAPIANTNATSPAVNTLRSEGAQFVVNATAAGNGNYINTVAFT